MRHGILAIALLAILSACQVQPNVKYPQLIFGPGAKEFFYVDSVVDGYASGNLLRAAVHGYNTSRKARTLRYRFVWLDTNGFELQGLSSHWQHLELRPSEPISIDRVAPDIKAVSYRVYLSDKNRSSASNVQGAKK